MVVRRHLARATELSTAGYRALCSSAPASHSHRRNLRAQKYRQPAAHSSSFALPADAAFTIPSPPPSGTKLRLPSQPRQTIPQRRAQFSASLDRFQRHTLRLTVEYRPPAPTRHAQFHSDAFFLPRKVGVLNSCPRAGIFATGGVPPKVWNLIVRVPGNFLMHTSGQTSKQSAKNSGTGRRADNSRQADFSGWLSLRYCWTLRCGNHHGWSETVNLWTRSPQSPEALRQPSEALARAIQAYNSIFGVRPKDSHQLWIVECPT